MNWLQWTGIVLTGLLNAWVAYMRYRRELKKDQEEARWRSSNGTNWSH